MNGKKAGWIFLIITLVYIGTTYVLSRYPILMIRMGFFGSLILSEAILWVPTLLILGFSKVNPIRFCRFKKIHVSTALMTVLFSVLIMPASTLMNILSMFFVDNVVAQMSGAVLQGSFGLAFFMMAVYGPLSEELVFRGAVFQGLKKSASPLKAILLSALLFGLMHMNFNQMGYAFVLGIFMALLVEATDSIWPAFICHMVVNGTSVVIMFATEKLNSAMEKLLGVSGQEALANASAEVTKADLASMLCVESLMVVILLPIAACVLVWIAKKEGGLDRLKALWKERKSGRAFSIPAVLGIVIALTYMIYTGFFMK